MSETRTPAGWLRRALPILTVVIALALIYDGWIFYSRWSSGRAIERERARNEAERARRTVQVLGGDQLKILGFYAVPPVIHPGQPASICFGVNGAVKVRIDPPIVEDLHPSLSRCFQISPKRDTEFKLTAEDGAGHALSQSLTVRVR
jgi:hypothetical protein